MGWFGKIFGAFIAAVGFALSIVFLNPWGAAASVGLFLKAFSIAFVTTFATSLAATLLAPGKPSIEQLENTIFSSSANARIVYGLAKRGVVNFGI